MRSRIRRLGALLAASALSTGTGLVVLSGTAAAATFTVTNTADDGSNTSLRDVIENQATNDGDIVVLTAGATYTLLDPPCSDLDLQADITIQSSSTTQNATIRQTCGDEEVISDSDPGAVDLVVQNVNITGGSDESDDGGGIDLGEGGDLTLIRSRVFGNAVGDSEDGGGLNVGGDATIIASTIDNNCAEDDAGAMEVDGDALIVNSTITQNVADDEAGAIEMNSSDGTLTLVYSDVVANTHDDGVDCGVPDAGPMSEEPGEAGVPDADDGEVEPADTNQPANLDLNDNDLFAFGSVVAVPIDPDATPFNCEFGDGGTTTSSGYNFSDDDTCGFTNTATGDRENAGDPGLGALADNGGPTPTLLPGATSPLVNFIPLAACGGGDALAGFAVTTDQRGITRPQDVGCEIGSVELELELVVLFTG